MRCFGKICRLIAGPKSGALCQLLNLESDEIVMARFSQVDRHALYPVEEWGDTLVLIPRGDAAGFNPATVNQEMATVTELAQSPGIRHLVIDLGDANYFGSVVLGGLVQLSQAVRNRGGRIAICNASQDMQDILRFMKLDTLWEVFPDRNVALRRIAKIPLKMHFWAWRKVGAWAAAIAAIVLVYVFYPRPNYGKIYYEQLSAQWREFQEKHDRAGEEEWARFSESSTKKLKPIIDHINKRALASRWEESERYVLYAARDHWPAALDRNNTKSQSAVAMIQACMRCTEAILEKRPVPIHVLHAANTGSVANSPSLQAEDQQATPQVITDPAKTTAPSK